MDINFKLYHYEKFYYVILSMIAIALVSCTSELDEINNTVHQQETLSGNELGANLMKSFKMQYLEVVR